MLKLVKQQTTEICLIAVQQNGNALRHVNEQNYEICLAAVQQNGDALKYVDEQSYEICLAAVQEYGASLKYIKEASLELCLAAVQALRMDYYDLPIKYVNQTTHEICLAAVQRDGESLKHIKEQCPEICLAAVQQNGKALNYVIDQTDEICLAAVQQNGESLKYVKKQSINICLAAVRSININKFAIPITYVQYQTPEICLAAVQQYGESLKFIKQQNDQLCLAAVQQNGLALQYVINQTYEICYAAIRQTSKAYDLVKDPLLKAQLPKKIPKGAKTQLKTITFKLPVAPQPRTAQPDLYLDQQLDVSTVIDMIHASWWQNRFQPDDYWLQWIKVMNGQQAKAPVKSHVAHQHAFFAGSAVFKRDDFNVYHYVRLLSGFEQDFFAINLTLEEMCHLKTTDIDIYFFIDFLTGLNPDLHDDTILNHLLDSPSSSATTLLLGMRHIEQFLILHFQTIQAKIPDIIKTPTLRKGLIQLFGFIPGIEPYIHELLNVYKTSKPIQQALTDYLAGLPAPLNNNPANHVT